VRLVEVPWARPGSGFTMLFEALVLTFAQAMPMSRVAAMTREHDTRVWRIARAPRAHRPGQAGLLRRGPGGDG
jgi:transposase